MNVIAQIASKILRIPTLERRMYSSLDYHNVGVYELKRALEAAYAAGHADGQATNLIEWEIFEADREYSREVMNDKVLATVKAVTKEQAELLYRASGDRSHTGPWAARK